MIVIVEANAILITLLEINIVEKNICGSFTKYNASLAASLFLRALISNFNLFATIKAISDPEKNRSIVIKLLEVKIEFPFITQPLLLIHHKF